MEKYWPKEVQNMLCLSRSRWICRKDYPRMSYVGTASCFKRVELSTLPGFRAWIMFDWSSRPVISVDCEVAVIERHCDPNPLLRTTYVGEQWARAALARREFSYTLTHLIVLLIELLNWYAQFFLHKYASFLRKNLATHFPSLGTW